MSSSSSPDLIADIEALLAAAKSHDVAQLDRIARLDLLAKVQNLHMQLEDPKEAMFRQFTNYTQTAAIRTLLEMGVVEKVPRVGTISAAEIASSTNADESLISMSY